MIDKNSINNMTPITRAMLAKKTTSQEVLRYLARDSNLEVVANVAQNPYTPEEIIINFYETGTDFIKRRVACNTSLSEENIKLLAVSPDYIVRGRVAENPRTSDFILDMMLNDVSEVVRNVARKQKESRKNDGAIKG